MLGNNEETKELLESIKKSESYLKARFRKHCNYNDSCMSHCINHGLSHPKDKELFSSCDKNHDRFCLECLNLVTCLASIRLKINQLPISHEKEVAEWEVENATFKIFAWQKHILRGAQQSKARSTAFTELGPTKAIWIRDYAEKVIPTKVIQIRFFLSRKLI